MCYADCTLTSGNAGFTLGGLVGVNRGDISRCHASGAVSGSFGAGGLVGMNSGHIANCYSSVGVSSRWAGGLAGLNGGRISNCFAFGSVSGGADDGDSGGLVGQESFAGLTVDCLWDTQASGLTRSTGRGPFSTSTTIIAGSTGLATSEMKDLRTYLAAGWDFVGERANGIADTWQMPATKGYPFLAALSTPRLLAGEGTAEDPYQIATPEDLAAIDQCDESACYGLTADLDLSGIPWTTSPVERFDGVFDGNGHVISRLTLYGGGKWRASQTQGLDGMSVRGGRIVPRPILGRGDSLGLFRVLGEHAKVKNLGVVGANVIGLQFSFGVGVLAGSNSGRIDGCYATGMVQGQAWSSPAGGLVGGNEEKGSISNSYAQVSVYGHAAVGALAGINAGRLSDCYATDDVAIQGERSGGKRPSGLVSKKGGVVAGCYLLAVPKATYLSISQGLPLSDAQMKHQSSFAGWDFNNVWTIREGKDYPRLRWEKR